MASPSPSMFIAWRDAKCSRLRRRRAGQLLRSHRQTTSPSPRTSSLPHDGQVSGICQGSARPSRSGFSTADDLRDDVAAFLDDDPVAHPDVLARDLVGVVQGRHADGGPGQQHRLEHGHRRHRSGAAHLQHDVVETGRRLLRGKLEGDRPPRELRGRPQALAVRNRVDLDHHAVGFVVETVPLVLPARTVRDQRLDAGKPFQMRLDRQPPCLERVEHAERASARRPGRRPDTSTRSAAARRPAADRAVARRRPRRCEDWQRAARPPPRVPG